MNARVPPVPSRTNASTINTGIFISTSLTVDSHWEVDSEATVALMDGLFEALKANPRLSHAEALRLSMLRMIANPLEPELAQPKFWSPFVVVGEPQKR
jgi:CHAT domain-containing protein